MSEELRDIGKKVERCIALLEGLDRSQGAHRAEVKEFKERIYATLHGRNGAAGLITRLDRLEQSQERQKWLVRVVVAKVIMILVGLLWAALTT